VAPVKRHVVDAKIWLEIYILRQDQISLKLRVFGRAPLEFSECVF
jgi:hypothetical protein